MKRVLPIAVIAVMGLLTFSSSSCSKKKSTPTCTCTMRGSHDQDTVETFTTVDTQFSSLAEECEFFDAFVKLDSARYGCHL